MKRIMALLGCMLLLCAVCAAHAEGGFTLEAMVEAMRIDEMAENYDTLKIEYTHGGDGSTVYYDLKQDMIFKHFQADEGVSLYIDNSMCGMAAAGRFFKVLIVGDVNMPIYAETGNLVYIEEATLKEELMSCEEKDGRLYIVTQLSCEETQAAYALEDVEVGDDVYAQMRYVLDAQTLAPVSCEEYLVAQDGTESLFRTLSFEYDVELPALDIAFSEYMAVTDDVRTMTVIADPDTEYEKAYSVQAPKGDQIAIYSISSAIYTDRDCTEAYTGDDGSEDITLYTRILSE